MNPDNNLILQSVLPDEKDIRRSADVEVIIPSCFCYIFPAGKVKENTLLHYWQGNCVILEQF